MSRRSAAPQRHILPDPKFHNDMLAKFMNVVMKSGKKAVAEGIVYGAFVAMRQTDFKFVIGFSSVSHMGIVLLGIAMILVFNRPVLDAVYRSAAVVVVGFTARYLGFAWNGVAHALRGSGVRPVEQMVDAAIERIAGDDAVRGVIVTSAKRDFMAGAEFQHPPAQYGQCTLCHSPHGSTAPAMLVKATLNQTCFSCHADKRGPLLWEHAPVAEDCSLCHTPHGSVRPALLTKTPPLLCQQCHSPAGHPSVPRAARGPNRSTRAWPTNWAGLREVSRSWRDR